MTKRFLHTVGMDEDGDVMTMGEVRDLIFGVAANLNPTLYRRQIDVHEELRKVEALGRGESLDLFDERWNELKRIL